MSDPEAQQPERLGHLGLLVGEVRLEVTAQVGDGGDKLVDPRRVAEDDQRQLVDPLEVVVDVEVLLGQALRDRVAASRVRPRA